MNQQITVAAAIIVRGGRIFCAKRSGKKANPHKWEFPGGKVERGETPEMALIREIKEELHTEIRIIGHYKTVVHPYDAYTVQLTTYWCEIVSGTIELIDHVEARFLEVSDLAKLDWAPADRPIVEGLTDVDVDELPITPKP